MALRRSEAGQAMGHIGEGRTVGYAEHGAAGMLTLFEHSVVNLFLFPIGLMLGGGFTLVDYLVWNETPRVLGNLVGARA